MNASFIFMKYALYLWKYSLSWNPLDASIATPAFLWLVFMVDLFSSFTLTHLCLFLYLNAFIIDDVYFGFNFLSSLKIFTFYLES